MVDSQPDQVVGSAAAPSSEAGHAVLDGQPQLTLHEFLTRLVSSAQERSAFEHDPQRALDQAGLGDVSPQDVLDATSLVLDYAPVEVVEEQGRPMQNSVEQFAAVTPHTAITPPPPFPEPAVHEPEPAPIQHEPIHHEGTADMMHTNSADFSANGDADQQMAPKEQDININQEQQDAGNLVNVHDNNVLGADQASNVSQDVSGVAHHGMNTMDEGMQNGSDNLSDVAQTGISQGPEALQNLAPDHALEAAPAPVQDLAGGDPASAVQDVASHVPAPAGDAVSGVAGPEGPLGTVDQAAQGLAADPAGAVQGIAGDPAGTAQHLAGGAASDLGGADHLL